jgi:hypothetical protein
LNQLGQNILTASGLHSQNNPLDPAKLAKLKAAVDSAITNNNTARTLDAQAQVARQKRDTSLGIAKGQNASTPDTVLNLVTYVRDQLLLVNEGNEEVLGEYGFNIVIGTARSPMRAQKSVTAAT